MQVAEEVLKEYIDDKMIKNRRIETTEDYSAFKHNWFHFQLKLSCVQIFYATRS